MIAVCAIMLIAVAVPASPQGDALTSEERQWLAQHGPILYGYEPNYAPFESTDRHGQAVGINFDLLDAMARNLDLSIEKVQYPDFDALLAAAERGDVDVLGTVNRTQEREAFLDFTEPYVRLSSVFYATDRDPDIDGLDDLEGRRVGIVGTYVSGQWLAEHHPELVLVPYDDLDALLAGLQRGDVDAIFEESATVGYMARENGMTGIRVLGTGAFLTSDQHFAVPDGETILTGILNKGLASIPLGERTKIFEYWTGYDLGVTTPRPDPISPLAFQILAVVGAVAAIVFGWVFTLRRQVRRQTLALRTELQRREAAEAEVRRQRENLAQRVRLRTAELERSNQDLQEFASTVSHDLQSPLSVIALKGRLVRSAANGDAAIDGYGAKIEEMVARMKEIIKSSLDYSKAKAHSPMGPVSLQRVLAEVQGTLESAIAESDAVIDVQPLPAVEGNHAQLLQLFQNLVGNAIKYRSHRRPEIRIWADPTGPHWRIYVADNGTGFDADRFEDLLRPFERLPEHAQLPGHGLGLAACERIVERHKGTLTAQSRPGRGSTFAVTLPRASGPVQDWQRPTEALVRPAHTSEATAARA